MAGQEQRPRAGVTSECVTEDVLSPCSHQPRNAPGRAGNGLLVVVVVVVCVCVCVRVEGRGTHLVRLSLSFTVCFPVPTYNVEITELPKEKVKLMMC